MTFPVQTPQNIYVGNGVQTVFAYGFEIPFQPDDATAPAVNVFLITPGTPTTVTELTYNTDYTLTNIEGQTGGNLTTEGSNSPIANGDILVIQRAMDVSQQTTFPNQGFLPSDIESTFDQTFQTIQQLNLVPNLANVSTVAGLPAANTVPFTRRFVLDATVLTYGIAPTGGGQLTASVYSDGVIWRMG